MTIQYKINHPIETQRFIQLLNASTLGERRPTDNTMCMDGMVKNANLLVSAWDEERLVGIARSVTDFHYACYLSDLAVHVDYQKQGIGKQLIRISQQQLGPCCKLILISAPAANDYYPKLGLENNPRCWILERDTDITG